MTSSSRTASALRQKQVIGLAQLITEGDDYATAAAEIVARGLTEDPKKD
jgi:hypothetical protein